ncbi:hypothetical protein KCV00_g30, partial [Aureobasidium melanogenum]
MRSTRNRRKKIASEILKAMDVIMNKDSPIESSYNANCITRFSQDGVPTFHHSYTDYYCAEGQIANATESAMSSALTPTSSHLYLTTVLRDTEIHLAKIRRIANSWGGHFPSLIKALYTTTLRHNRLEQANYCLQNRPGERWFSILRHARRSTFRRVRRSRQAKFNNVVNWASSRLLNPTVLLADVASALPIHVLLFVWT